MAGVEGFEPANDGVRDRCLTAWRYPCVHGAFDRIRTDDPRLTMAVLYLLSYES